MVNIFPPEALGHPGFNHYTIILIKNIIYNISFYIEWHIVLIK
jgi:hypothetical protein